MPSGMENDVLSTGMKAKSQGVGAAVIEQDILGNEIWNHFKTFIYDLS